MSFNGITCDPSLLRLQSLRPSGQFQQLEKWKSYLCRCIAFQDTKQDNQQQEYCVRTGSCEWIACEYFMSLNLMNPQVISKTECPTHMKQYWLFCDIINAIWQQIRAIFRHKSDCKSKQSRAAQSDIIPSPGSTTFGNISDGIEMACCHIRAKIGLYRRGPVQFLPDLMSMELHLFNLDGQIKFVSKLCRQICNNVKI